MDEFVSKEQLERIIETIAEGVLVIAKDGRIIYANAAAERLSGRSRGDIIGRAFNDPMWKVTTPDGRPYPDSERPFMRAITTGRQVHGVELVIERPDGTRPILSFNATPLRDGKGELVGTVETFSDVTRLKRAAKEVRESRREILDILESITDGFFALDNDWRFTYVNRKAAQLLERRREELLFKNGWSEFPEAVGTMFYKEFFRAKEEMVPVSFEEFYPPLDKWFEVRVYPYKNGLSIYFTDVTERKREEELSDALDDINAAISSMLDFNEIMRKAMAEGAKAIGAEAASVNLREDDHWALRYVYGLPEEIVGTRFTREEAEASELAIKTRKPIVSNDAFSDERLSRKTVEKLNIRSILIVPLIARERAIGVLVFSYHSAPTTFTDIQVNAATKLAMSVSLALENARLYSMLQERNH